MEDRTDSDEGNGPVKWLGGRISRTILPSYKLLFPRTWKNPMTYLGLLSFSSFAILGLSGVALMFYYSPDFVGSYDSVSRIMTAIPFGLDLRNMHYYASDVMVLLALAHFFYLYFVGKYRYKNEVLWITGLAFGVLAVLEAYTGYVLIMNTRAMLAVNIGAGLLNSISPALSNILVGGSYADLVLRVYALHIAILPAIMVLLTLVHFPRTLTVDLPSVSVVGGLVLVVGGLFPVDLGAKFVVNSPAAITVPEWYLSGVYALLRTGAPVFIAGIFLPFLLIFILSLVPFYVKGDISAGRTRPIVVGLGGAVLAQTVLITIWGLRGGGLLSVLTAEGDLIIDPTMFWSVFWATGAFAFLVSGLLVRKNMGFNLLRRSDNHGWAPSRSISALLLLVAAQVALLVHAMVSDSALGSGTGMVDVGLAIILFGFALRVYLNTRATSRELEELVSVGGRSRP